RGHAGVARDGVQPRQGEVFLPGLEHDGGPVVHPPAQGVEVAGRQGLGRVDDHDAAPAPAYAGSRPMATRRTISPRSPDSGTIASGTPARATKPGLRRTTLV